MRAERAAGRLGAVRPRVNSETVRRMAAEHPNLERTREAFAAFGAGDFGVLEALLGKDATWRIGGSSLLADVYRGRRAILDMLRRTATLSGGRYRVDPLWALADDNHVVVVYRARGVREGRSLDIEQALLCTLEAGQWVDVVALPTDQLAFDEFWS